MKRVFAAFILTGVANTMLGPLMPGFEARWHLDDARAGLLFTAQFLASVLLAAVVPALGRRVGYRRAVAIGLATVAAGVAGCMADSWPAALAAVALYGCGLGIVVTGSNLAVASISGGNSAHPLLWLNFCWSVGAVAAPWLVAGLRGSFLPIVALGLTAFALAVGMPAGKASPHQVQPRSGIAPPHLTCALLLFLYVGVETSVAGWISTYAMRSASAGALWAALPSIFWFAILLGRAAAPGLLHRVPAPAFAPASLILSGLGAVVLLAASGSGGMVAGSLITGFGFAPIFPVTVAWYTDRSGSAVSGLVFSAAGLGGAAIPPLVGFVSTFSGSLRAGLASVLVVIPVMIWLQYRLGR